MTNSVTLNGNTYNDGETGPNNMAAGGHRNYLIPMLSDAVADLAAKQSAAAGSASAASGSATAAATSATSAVNAPGTSGTSSTSLTIGTGAQAFTTQTGKNFVVGQPVVIASTAAPTNWMAGTIAAYNSGTGAMTVNVTNTNGSGTVASWSIGLAGVPGVTGPSGANAYAGRSARTSNTMLGASDTGKLIDITSGTFTQTFDAVATLGATWHCWIRNAGTGDVTLDPNLSETIDGLTSYIMYPGEVRLVMCDGTALRSVVLQAYNRTFTASGTYIKPPGYQQHAGLNWGAGGSGGAATGSTHYSAGGGGGACVPFILADSVVPASVTVTIGAGGASVSGVAVNGNAGGNSTFGTLVTAYGGGWGAATSTNGSSPACGGGGGGAFGAGNNGFSGSTSAAGGQPIITSNNVTNVGFGGADGSQSAGGTAVYGGGGGGGTGAGTGAGNVGGKSLWGGGGGGACGNSAAAGGASTYGGAGGAAGLNAAGTAGTAPGGGGGSSTNTDATQRLSGAGARGEIRIWGIV